MAFSNLGLTEPTPHDPSQANVWAATVNGNMTLIDNAIAGVLPLTVTSANVILTAVNGSPDQARNAHFGVTGALTGNQTIFFPAGRTEMFSVSNGCTGAFTLTIAVNNGSGSPAGSTVVIPQGGTLCLASDGTNITVRINAAGLGALLAANNLDDVASASTALTNLGAKNGATTTVFIQSGGSPSGGNNGDLFFIY